MLEGPRPEVFAKKKARGREVFALEEQLQLGILHSTGIYRECDTITPKHFWFPPWSVRRRAGMGGRSCLYYIYHECGTITPKLFAFLLKLIDIPSTTSALKLIDLPCVFIYRRSQGFYSFIPPGLVWPWQSECNIHHYLVRLDGIVLCRRLSMFSPICIRCVPCSFELVL